MSVNSFPRAFGRRRVSTLASSALILLSLASLLVPTFAQDAPKSKFMQIRADKENVVSFEPRAAKFLRVKIFSSQGGAPALDEVLVYGPNDEAKNMALDARADASSCIEGYAIHKIENINDGEFGNDSCWVAGADPSNDAPQWVSLEWKEPVEIARVVFSRDRKATYSDRVPLKMAFELSDDGENWTAVALVQGTTNTVDAKALTPSWSDFFGNAPQSAPADISRFGADSLPSDACSKYDLQLRNAFLGEENALLKIAGFADCEPWLMQRHYPEYVEPLHKPESVSTLTALDLASDFGAETRAAFAKRASSATVWSFAGGSFGIGPVLEQTARVAVVGDKLRVSVTGDRFLSEHRAMIATEGLPTRGFIGVRDGKIFWDQVDAFDGREAGSSLELDGVCNPATGYVETAIPLDFLPEAQTRGIYVALDIGGRWVRNGGIPAHFRPADFSVSLSNDADADAKFALRVEATGSSPVKLAVGSDSIELAAGESTELVVSGEYGQVGPEVVWSAVEDGTNASVQLVGFRYDPCYRPFCQLKDALVRAAGSADDGLDERDFQKRTAIPGVANPRYVDVKAVVDALNLPNEREDLVRWVEEARTTAEEGSFEARFVQLWDEYLGLAKYASNPVAQRAFERELFWKVRLLKREFTLSNDDLESIETILANKRNPFHPSHNYSDLFDSEWNPGGAVVLIDIPRENGRLAPEHATTREVVQAGEGVIRNPSPSFDATKIFYALRENQNEYFRIYELNLATGEKRRISAEGPFHDFWPTELPDGGLAFISTRCKKKFICWRPQAFVLHRMNMDGTGIEQLSVANLSEFAPSVCDDGRLMWTRSEYVDKGADYGHTIWTIRTDGTVPELTFGNTINLPQGYANGRRVPDCDDVSCILISHFGDLNGPVALIDQAKGPHDPSAVRSITPEVPWPGFWPKTEGFREPFPISRDFMLVAHAAFDRFGIYLLDRYGNRELLTIDDSIDTICPQIFAPRDVPPVVKSAFEPNLKAQNLGRFSVANVYRGLEGQVEPGTAKYLRVCQEMPTPLKQMSDGTYQTDHEPFMEYYASPVDILQGPYGWSSYVAKGVIGTAEVQEDGSVDFIAPAEKVLFFQLLDENFNEIQRMRSVVQLKSGEQRSCIGCHESRLSSPEGGLTQASGRQPQTLVPPSWGAGPFWYERVVQPVLDKNCVECHTADTAAKNQRQFNLTGTLDNDKIPASYRSLIQSGDVHHFDYTWGAGKTTKAAPFTFGTFQSKLWTILKDENHKNVELTTEEERAIKCWIDLNVPLWGDYEKRSERE